MSYIRKKQRTPTNAYHGLGKFLFGLGIFCLVLGIPLYLIGMLFPTTITAYTQPSGLLGTIITTFATSYTAASVIVLGQTITRYGHTLFIVGILLFFGGMYLAWFHVDS